MLDVVHKQQVSDTVTQNPYFDRCSKQAKVVRDLQEKVQLLLQQRKCNGEKGMARQIIEPMKNQRAVNKKVRIDPKRNRVWSIVRSFRRRSKFRHQLHMMRLQLGEV